MKRFMTAMAMAAVGTLATTAWAQAPASRPAGGEDGRRSSGAMYERLTQGLDLTAEQQPKVQQIIDAFAKEMAAWQSENQPQMKTLRERYEAAEKAGDKDTAQSTRQEMAKLMESRKAPQDNLEKQLAEVLTTDQMAKLKDRLPGHQGSGAYSMANLAGLDLTDDQKTKIKEIREEMAAAAEKATDRQGKEQAMKDGWQKIEAVLTPEQKTKFEESKKSAATRPARAGEGASSRRQPGSAPAQ